MQVDFLLVHSRELLTLAPSSASGGSDSGLGIIPDGAVAGRNGLIVEVGQTDEVLRRVSAVDGAVVVDATGRVAMPGFVDPHTHLVHAGSRADEFARRLAGEDYLKILAEGGGILRTVEATRGASEDELERTADGRLRQMLAYGTTTAEVKSGYGLDLETELKILRVVRRLRGRQPIDLIPTFLGAHAIPVEYRGRPEEYVELVCGQMLPAVAREGLAVFCDVFCERGVFSVEQSRRIMTKAVELGLRARLHADELAESGGAWLAAEVGALSADHLTFASPDGLRRMARAGVVAVLLPGASYFLDHPYADARAMIDEYGLEVALATDYNPGTSPILSMPTVISLACVKMRMTVAEAIRAATRGAARALGMQSEVGALEMGKRADIIVLEADSHQELIWGIGSNPVEQVIKGGRVAFERGVK
ncbi:MAG: imidazolonepropionase [Chloroflexota bacterium]